MEGSSPLPPTGGASPSREDSTCSPSSSEEDHNQAEASMCTSTHSHNVPSPAFTDTPLCWDSCGAVRKSRTHDCVAGMGRWAGGGGRTHDGGGGPRVRLVSSLSFSGFGVSLSGQGGRLLRENHNAAGGSREIIDYRNLTPQVPFVPSIAKSIPKKRISLRRPKKAIKDLFGMKRYNPEKTAPTPCAMTPAPRRTKQTRHLQERGQGGLGAAHEHSDPPSDSSLDCYGNACEDVTSLKSFGSQTGCGEIFADEQHVSPEAALRLGPGRECEKASPVVGSFQGGVEQMASPAQTEISDLLRMWDNRGGNFSPQQNLGTQSKTAKAAPTPATTPCEDKVVSPSTTPVQLPECRTVELNTDKATPKSDNQEITSTSDEGYYESVSPGQEDDGRESFTPCLSSQFPRDSYSGDALYELFYDPSESRMTPIFDEDLNLAESVLSQVGDLPLSMYSFHVGAEENLAPPLALDFVGQELLHSSWRGKECLLKLCDTEISLAMGIVSWLRQKAERSSSTGSVHDRTAAQKSSASLSGGEPCTEVLDIRNKLSRVDGCVANPVSDRSAPHLQEIGDAPYKPNKEEPILASPGCGSPTESRVKTPASGFCFRIFNKDSPPCLDLKSPMLQSPGGGADSVFLLAINRESLCASCRSSLKLQSKELHLCSSCLSFIEHIEPSSLLCGSGSEGTPCSPSVPQSPALCPGKAERAAGLVGLLEQCVGGVSSMSIDGNAGNDQERGAACRKPVEDMKHRVQSSRYLKSKTKLAVDGVETNGSSLGSHLSDAPASGAGLLPPSLLEAGSLGLVTTNSSDELVLQEYGTPCPDGPGSSFLGGPSQAPAPRPTYLPLSNSAYSEFASTQTHAVAHGGAKGQPRERLRRHKRSSVKRDGPCGYSVLEEKKVERKRRFKK